VTYPVMTNGDNILPRTIRLLHYLEAVRGLREQSVRDVVEYQDRRWWAADIPDHPSCTLTATGTEPWLTVSKAELPPPPPVPAEISSWLRGPVTDPEREPVFPDEFDDWHQENPEAAGRLQEALREYVQGPWERWARQARPAVAARKLYDDLYELRLRLQREAALVELVWGHGILSWTATGTRIVHPMVTTQVRLGFDPGTGTLTIEPEALAPQLEIDLLQGLNLNGFDLLVDVREGFRGDPVGPFDANRRDLYQRLVAPLGLDGRVADGDRPAEPASAPVITASWVLLVRRRRTMYRRFFAGLRDALEAGQAVVPAPLAAVVADEPSLLDSGETLSGADADWRRTAERLLMPLPTNPEQEEVARRLAEHRGVTVQGPPGTGKTHTIANLISHLVAHGKRVLVTSQKEQALTVLRDKIPESIRDLSVAVLGGSAASLAQLDQSVQAIYERAVALDRGGARARVAGLESRLDEVQREVGTLRSRISASIARERDSYAVGSVPYSPSTLAQWLAANAAARGYIPDRVEPGASCPLSAAQIADLYGLARTLDPDDRAQARLRLPELERLPSPWELASAADELRDVRDRLAATEDVVENRIVLERLGPDGLSALTDSVERTVGELSRLEQPWLATIRAELRTAVFAANWRDHVKAMREGIEELAAWRGRLLEHHVVLPGDGLPLKELLEQLGRLRDRLAAGKGVNKTFQKELYQVRAACAVDEEPPRGPEDVELCIIEARSRRRRYEIVNRWNEEVGRVGGPMVTAGPDHAEYAVNQHVEDVAAALSWEEGRWEELRDRLRASGVRAPEVPASADLAAIAASLRTAALYVRERELAAWLDSVRKYLADGGAAERASALWQALADAFGSLAWDQWGRMADEVRRVRGLVGDVARLDDLFQRLAEAAPVWARRILQSRGDEAVAGPAGSALQAWEWRQAETWLGMITGGDDPSVLQRQLEGKLRMAGTLTADLASESAWLSVAQRLTDAERRALTAWVQALRRVGKGTGKYAAHWRAEAQKNMEQAQTAVPVWIMPAHRVVESFDPATAMFDVVIVDESSQCDLFGLAALGIARKAIVVGDDKQISPQAIGTHESAVHELIRQHISDLPQAQLLDIKASLYDLSKMRFPGVIMLREHFRCLPEIIEFSNQLAYGGKILPLREQPADESWQSVIDVAIPDGYREPGTDTNPPEAEFITAKIAELCADPRYDGKTFGVVSLLGDAQAELIERMLIERLGEQEMERRRIRCGNAYHFQGDERSVMFLSMVVAAGEGRRIGAMTKDADRQRINVAASRAQDQMWCVRSISPDELHPDDVRNRFIRYCQNPALVAEALGEVEDRFDSDFERDVYRQIVARGYRVKVQHPVGRFRIDLVVEGQRGRLAVELDGDAYHGPDRWEADRNRQTILERLGWTFHRIRGSAYYRDPDAALGGLWDRLEVLGIRPVGYSSVPGPEAAGVHEPRAPEQAGLEESAELQDDLVETEVPASADIPIDDPLAVGVRLPVFAPHRGWQPRPLSDVDDALQWVIVDGIVDIVKGEGPVVTDRIYELYVRACGGQRVTRPRRDALREATDRAISMGLLDQIGDHGINPSGKTVYLPGTQAVIVRTRGDRELEHIPPTEVAAVVRHVFEHDPGVGTEELKRILLTAYDRVRLTENASFFLDECIGLAQAARKTDIS
jgi:very-short-patch-repair endonuclease